MTILENSEGRSLKITPPFGAATHSGRFPVVCPLAALALLTIGCSRRNTEELLTQHRNLGKAYYENPATQQETVREFRKAWDLARNSPREKINYALA